MLTLILVAAIFFGFFFRSPRGFVLSLIALFLLLYPVPTISVMLIAGLAFYLFYRRQIHGYIKLNYGSIDDDKSP